MMRARITIRVLVIVAVGLASTASAQLVSDDVAAMKTLLEKLIETKKLISKEKQRATEQKVLLEDQIRLMEARVEDVEEKIAETKKNVEIAEEKRRPLDEEDAQLKESLQILEAAIAQLEARTLKVLAMAPQSVHDKIKLLSQRIPKDPGKTSLSLSVRYQNVIGVLDTMTKFNNALTVETGLREVDGQSVEVRVMYVGLGQAYFANNDGTIGGVGVPGENGWIWTPKNEIAPAVASAIKQYMNEEQASFELVPVTVKNAE